VRKLKAVISREYKEVVKKKSFLVGTLLTPVFMFLIIFLPSLLIHREAKDPIEFTLVDLNSGLLEEFQDAFSGNFEDGRPIFVVDYISSDADQIDLLKAELNRKVDRDELNFYVIIPVDIIETGKADRYAKKHGKLADIETVRSVISKVVIRERLAEYEVPAEEVNALTRDVSLSYHQVGPEGKEKGSAGFLIQYLSGLAFVMILFSSIIGYGQHLLRAVMEEKNSRVIEVLVSSLTPFQLMMGKILGLGAAGITQMIIWMILGVAFFFFGSSSTFLAGLIENARALSLTFFFAFAAFFILGYFLYATLFALLGSIISSEREAQQFIAPITMVLILPIMLGIAIMQNPDAGWVVALSYIPFLTPTLMIMRSSFSFIPISQLVIGMVILLISIFLLGWLAARIFRVGILMYGKRPTLPELVKWVRYK